MPNPTMTFDSSTHRAGRSLVAGFGNVLRGDDGFGVEVVHRLADDTAVTDVADVLEVGTGGMRLVQALVDGYDRLIIVDAVRRDMPPGTIFTLAVESFGDVEHVDMHMALPASVLALAAALRALPREVFIVGCEPAETDELSLDLSDAVRAALPNALERIRELVSREVGAKPPAPLTAGDASPGAA